MGFNNCGYDSPCKSCKDRVLHCHSKCDKYSNYRKMLDEINAKKNEINEYKFYRRDAKSRMITKRCTNGVIKCGKHK